MAAPKPGGACMSRQFHLKLIDAPQPAAPAAAPTAHADRAMPLHPAHPGPQKAMPSIVPQGATAEEAFRITLTQCRWHIAANIPAVVEQRDIEGMHQLRVAFRRLRVAFAAFGPEFRTPSLEALRERARHLASRMSEARDLDVFIGELLEPASRCEDSQGGFVELRTRAEAARKSAWDRALAVAGGPALSEFLEDLGNAIDHRQWLEEAVAHPEQKQTVFQEPARDLAARVMARRFRHVKARARGLNRLSVPERHQLRIALKKLRYTSEFFAPFFAEEKFRKFQRRLSRMQDILGALNDVAVARSTLDRLTAVPAAEGVATDSSIAFAAGIVYGWHLERAAHMWEEAKARWKKLARNERFWETATAQ